MMTRRLAALAGAAGVVVGLGLWLTSNALAEDPPSRATRTRTRTTSGSQADLGRIEEKLDQLLERQQDILQRLDDIAQQLRHIKSRAVQ